jgi:hypothetical protein
MLNRISRQLILAVFWFLSAYFAIGAVLPWEWAWRCAWFNLIIGMAGLLLVTGTREGDKLFYEGPAGDQPGRLSIALLWTLPPVGFIVAAIWWLMRLIGFFDW